VLDIRHYGFYESTKHNTKFSSSLYVERERERERERVRVREENSWVAISRSTDQGILSLSHTWLFSVMFVTYHFWKFYSGRYIQFRNMPTVIFSHLLIHRTNMVCKSPGLPSKTKFVDMWSTMYHSRTFHMLNFNGHLLLPYKFPRLVDCKLQTACLMYTSYNKEAYIWECIATPYFVVMESTNKWHLQMWSWY